MSLQAVPECGRKCEKHLDEAQARQTKVVGTDTCGAAANEICSSLQGKSVATGAYSGGALIVKTPNGPRLGGIIVGGSTQFDVSVKLPLQWIAEHAGVKAS